MVNKIYLQHVNTNTVYEANTKFNSYKIESQNHLYSSTQSGLSKETFLTISLSNLQE